MKDKLEHNMYVRTKWGIAKIIEISEEIIYVDTCFQPIDETKCYKEDIIGEPSFNPIDLIEVGDYVNGYKIVKVFENKFNGKKILVSLQREDEYEYSDNLQDYMCDESIHIYSEDIKSIVTKEQFESMEYRLGDDK